LTGAVGDEAISGAEVARRLGVSRSTVLRAIGEVKMIARETMRSYLARA
jgi:biotin operon repressor